MLYTGKINCCLNSIHRVNSVDILAKSKCNSTSSPILSVNSRVFLAFTHQMQICRSSTGIA